MTKKSNEIIDDMINTEVTKIEKNLENVREKISECENEIAIKKQKIRQLLEIEARYERDLEKAKKQMTKLKRSVWTSDNPNIVELRNQLLMTAKLIDDQEQKG